MDYALSFAIAIGVARTKPVRATTALASMLIVLCICCYCYWQAYSTTFVWSVITCQNTAHSRRDRAHGKCQHTAPKTSTVLLIAATWTDGART
eukprot:4695487-Pleurochrysis_carterae.AAC.3